MPSFRVVFIHGGEQDHSVWALQVALSRAPRLRRLAAICGARQEQRRAVASIEDMAG